MANLKLSDLNKLQKNVETGKAKGSLKGGAGRTKVGEVVRLYQPHKKSAGNRLKIVLPKKEARQLAWIKSQLSILGIKFIPEFQFAKPRKFRADIALSEHKILIEYEGIINLKNNNKSGHTTIKGYTKDTEKYNLAGVLGYTVLRYTAINYRDSLRDVADILKL